MLHISLSFHASYTTDFFNVEGAREKRYFKRVHIEMEDGLIID